ncbi:MAG: 30S ribosomal protein S8 [Alphaproteobacteria bacterium]|nr:30S ribosomal protein S8 [Alphaproteobacteria bacterium]
MSMNDVLSDMIARIKNGQRAMLQEVRCPASRLLEAVLKVLESEGYIGGFSRQDLGTGRSELQISLKYHEGEAVIKEIKRISRPGRRVYRAVDKLPKFHNGLGISVLSTSHGVMSDFEARQTNVGGEVLCSVF